MPKFIVVYRVSGEGVCRVPSGGNDSMCKEYDSIEEALQALKAVEEHHEAQLAILLT